MSDKELPKDKKSDGVEPEESLEQSSTETANEKIDPETKTDSGESEVATTQTKEETGEGRY